MVITKSISRFARNVVTLLKYVRELKELNIDVYLIITENAARFKQGRMA